MPTREETIATLAKTMENISKILASVADNQNKTWKEVNKQQLDLLRYQCEVSNKLMAEMWEELKKEDK